MADRVFADVQALDKYVKVLSGKVSIAADATVSSNTILGVSSTGVARTGAGTYTITLQDAYPELLAVHIQMGAATAVDLVAQIVSETVSTTKIITFKTLTGAVATDAAAACFAYVTIVLKNSTIAP
jgi:hypothetical protein